MLQLHPRMVLGGKRFPAQWYASGEARVLAVLARNFIPGTPGRLKYFIGHTHIIVLLTSWVPVAGPSCQLLSLRGVRRKLQGRPASCERPSIRPRAWRACCGVCPRVWIA